MLIHWTKTEGLISSYLRAQPTITIMVTFSTLRSKQVEEEESTGIDRWAYGEPFCFCRKIVSFRCRFKWSRKTLVIPFRSQTPSMPHKIAARSRLTIHGRACPTSPSHQHTASLVHCLVEEADDLAGDVLPSRLLVVHDAGRGGQDDVAELTGRQQLDNPLLQVGQADVVAGGDDSGLVQAGRELVTGQRVS